MIKSNTQAVITLRLSPEVKYLLDIATRKNRLSIAKYVEEAIESTFNKALLNKSTSVNDDRENLWKEGSDEIDRFLYLVKQYPELLNSEENKILEVLKTFEVDGITFYENKNWNLSLIKSCWVEIINYATCLSDFTGFTSYKELSPKAKQNKYNLEKIVREKYNEHRIRNDNKS